MAMQSIELPAVTQIRASDDYVPPSGGPTAQNWNLGGSSILAHAIALAPFKDSFWTTPSQPNGSLPNAREFGWALHSAVATLSAGPVTPSDGINMSNVPVIMRTCRADGTLLHPARPATYTDYMIRARADAPFGHLWSTYSEASGLRWDHIFSREMESLFNLTPSVLTLDGGRADVSTAKLVAYSLNTSSLSLDSLQVQHFSETAPVTLVRDTSAVDFALWHVAPIDSSGWAFLGDLTKYVPTSSARLVSAESSATSSEVTIVGAVGESVTLTWANAAGSTEAAAAGENRRYVKHVHEYCDNGTGHETPAYSSNTDTLTECQTKCDVLACTCFDYNENEKSSDDTDALDRCRVSTIDTTLTSSSTGYDAFTPIAPPPPRPAQLATASVTCIIGASGNAIATLSSKGEAHCA